SLALAPESWTRQLGTRDELARENLFLYRAYETVRRRAFDIIDDNSGMNGILVAAQSRLQAPVVATLHGALSEAEGDFLNAVDRQVTWGEDVRCEANVEMMSRSTSMLFPIQWE